MVQTLIYFEMKIKISIFAATIIWSLTMGKSGNIMALNHYNSVFNTKDSIDWKDGENIFFEDSIGNFLSPDFKVVWDGKVIEEFENEDKPEEPKNRNNTYVPDSWAINTGLAVGEIPITSATTQTGAVTYSVPIEVYPGINGMQPELAIVYNSHAGNGFIGVGWNIGGLSSITRGNMSRYYDGKAEGIKMTKDDALYLDGMRLIFLSEDGNKRKYETEQGNIKVWQQYRWQ